VKEFVPYSTVPGAKMISDFVPCTMHTVDGGVCLDFINRLNQPGAHERKQDNDEVSTANKGMKTRIMQQSVFNDMNTMIKCKQSRFLLSLTNSNPTSFKSTADFEI
jgi:hypothetical protein